MEVILDILKDHAFFKNIEPDYFKDNIRNCKR